MRNTVWVVIFASSLTGCSGIPTVPYEEPAQSAQVARIRVITNSDVSGDSIAGGCAPATRHKMAEAGRFGRDGWMNTSYPQYPVAPVQLGMPQRTAPKLVEYIPAIRMAEGQYQEVVTEYRVRADLPFQIATLGATIGSYGSSYSSCPGKAAVYKLEPGKDYEALVGVGSRPNGEGGYSLTCVLAVAEISPLAGTPLVLPLMLSPSAPPKVTCKP